MVMNLVPGERIGEARQLPDSPHHPLLVKYTNLLKGIAVVLPDNLESEWDQQNGMWRIVFVEWHGWVGKNGMAKMEAGGLECLVPYIE